MTEVEKQRIQKLIANAGLCSRREAERLIEDGKVRVNGKIAQLGDKARISDDIFVNNKPLNKHVERSVTVLMNKPKGVLCTNSDPHADRTVFDLLPLDLQRQRMFCAGRLDKDSEGLLVLTNDGDLAHRITHPTSNVVKRYRVVLHRDFDKADIPKLLNGVDYEGDFLKAEKVIPAPAVGEGHLRRLEVHLHHGKKREIRRLFEANRYYVKKLVRVQIGGMVLKNMPKGGIKVLGKKDIERLFA
ncbi:pseudouridine synthase [Coraliomargarita akajimensis]|uniref:Pseudouridine synthase n=1 Tax=Coraliomargarita akajimensis (strain DSM 45221 / IAM 15411 / JCM 23193 / KCTC 12865 / 04OKA010-24) TaxID=583355 RepID=D5EIU1_CORAD|nr:pseudouridine synthase [Coraliomargarita akajimensis]ADE54340.1 pseudouridine synthase [Coraliomargarita akajimensis DSM 45221]